MLLVMILTSLFTLAVMNYGIWKPPAKRDGFTMIELLLAVTTPMGIICSGLYSMCFGLFSSFLLQLAISLLGLIGLAMPRHGRRVACGITVFACAVPWGIVAGKVLVYHREVDELLKEYPFVTIEDRLPTPNSTPNWSAPRLDAAEKIIGTSTYDFSQAWHLEILHSEHVKDFTSTPGFGVDRMPNSRFRPAKVRHSREYPEPIPQPGVLREEIDYTGDALPDAKVQDFFGFHVGSIGNFANIKSFGYFKNRRKVAGFAPHAFESEPKPQVPYTLERLELVGLVRNPEPAVYVSEFLPRMVELDAVTMRPADGFEAAALKKLAAGEDLVANAVGSKVRLLGAIRNMASCVECHGGRRGDLLGAFSYRLAETTRRAE